MTSTDPADATRRHLGLGYVPLLDSVRAIAIGLVLLYHGQLAATSAGGSVGVTTFFVLSGYLITELLARERLSTGRIALLGFYERRAIRLLPALTVMLAVSAIVLVAMGRKDAAILTSLVGISPLSNWVLTSGQDLGPITHVWTLAIEWQFYLGWPLLLGALLPRLGRARLAFLLVSIAVAVTIARSAALANGWPVYRAQYGSDMQADAFLIGGALALLGDRLVAPRLIFTGGAAVVILVAIAPLGILTWPLAILGASGLVLGARRGGDHVIGPVMGNSLVRHFGRLSYGVYLWQYPVIWHVGLSYRATSPAVNLLAIAASIGLAELSYRLMERPIVSRRASRRLAHT